jgi:pyruvate/2-oxoglutarate dehydrogenase complex dihydrolipoamide dehydrogenase (E3) component
VGRLGPRGTLDRTDGLTKLILDPARERLLGVGLVGPGAGELIAEGVLAIEMGATPPTSSSRSTRTRRSARR